MFVELIVYKNNQFKNILTTHPFYYEKKITRFDSYYLVISNLC